MNIMEDKKITQKERLQYHIVPPYGLLNDPNGLCYFNGRHHVFYQWNQKGTVHQTKSWGHVSTNDFVHWQTHPPALEPTDWFDQDGCYSGSAVVYQNKLYLFYTGNVKNEGGERRSYQCMASSEDGIHFKKYGPILKQPKGYTAHIRDPKVWMDEEGIWNMILGAQTVEKRGTALLYQSNDLTEWEFLSDMGETLPKNGYMWECPDLISIRNQQIFLYCPQGSEWDSLPNENIYQSGYRTGTLSKQGIFDPQGYDFQKVDAGFEFYAPQTYKDSSGRIILFGWLGLMSPEKEVTFPSIQEGYIHALTIPRLVDVKEGRLIQTPLSELKELRMKSPVAYINKSEIEFHFLTLQNEMEFSWETVEQLKINIRKEVKISYQASTQEIIVSRTDWATGVIEKRIARVDKPLQHLQIFMENSSLELFVNKGEKVFSMRYVADESTLTFQLEQTKFENSVCTIWPLKSYQGILP